MKSTILTALQFFLLVMIWVPAPTSAEEATNELANPGFEEGAPDKSEGWKAYGRGYETDREVFHGGKRSLRCTARGGQDGMGAVQIILYEKPDRRPVIVGGWSKAENIGGGGDYCVYLDIIYEDGSPWWAKTSRWRRGTHDWEYNAEIFYPRKPVREIRAYVFIRRTTGTAWFDDVKVCRGGLHVTGVRVGSDYPRSRHGVWVRAGLTKRAEWECMLRAAAGNVLASSSGKGNKIAWVWPGREGAVPKTVTITGKTSGGETVKFNANVERSASRENPVVDGYAVWQRNSMAKVYPTEFPETIAPSPEASLSLARNEREGMQVAITPSDSLTLKDVRIEVGQFSNENGDVLPAELVEWHVVGYIRVETPSGHPLAPAEPSWCPDVLLPGRPFDVPGGRTQTVWLNFFAPDEVQPGAYRGKVTIRPANAEPTDLRLKVQIWNFSLPRSPRMKTAFAIMDGFTRQTYGKVTPEMRRKGIDLMLDHRLNPDDISRTEPPRIEDLLYARERGMNTFNILNLVPKPEGNPPWVCLASLKDYGPNFNQELEARIKDTMDELRKHGLSKMAYFYGFDERREEYDDLIKGICKFLKERYPEVSTFTTAGYMYHKREKTPPGYRDYMDWYCPLTSVYKPELSEKLRALGKQVWWYVCCGPQYPHANFSSMDYPTIEGRLLSWMTWSFKADGLLFWHVNYWGDNKIIDWQEPYLDWKPTCIHGMTGDGVLTYPTPDGPVSSIRLESVRDGIEDYDYLCLLADLKGREAAAKYTSRLVRSMTEYSRKPDDLHKAREEIAAEIEGAE